MNYMDELKDLRTKEELIKYFKEKGKDITEEEIEVLKKNFNQTKDDNNNLTMKQLDSVAGGAFGLPSGEQHFNDPQKFKKNVVRTNEVVGENFLDLLHGNYNQQEDRTHLPVAHNVNEQQHQDPAARENDPLLINQVEVKIQNVDGLAHVVLATPELKSQDRGLIATIPINPTEQTVKTISYEHTDQEGIMKQTEVEHHDTHKDGELKLYQLGNGNFTLRDEKGQRVMPLFDKKGTIVGSVPLTDLPREFRESFVTEANKLNKAGETHKLTQLEQAQVSDAIAMDAKEHNSRICKVIGFTALGLTLVGGITGLILGLTVGSDN